jgi:hypothetical protein
MPSRRNHHVVVIQWAIQVARFSYGGNMGINVVLQERGTTHGHFTQNAEMAQALKRLVHNENASPMTDVQHEALDNICQKLAHIVCGNASHADHWLDIAGYATLVVDSLNG